MILRNVIEGGFEPNPYPTDAPDFTDPDSSALRAYFREQAQILRDQHSMTSAGDTTFSWELMTRTDLQPAYRPGSLGRFYHREYGVILARYCKLGFMTATEWTGAPVGLQLGVDPWTVTNEISRSSPTLVVGLGAWYSSAVSGAYGWVVCSGASIQGVTYAGVDEPQFGEELVWGTEYRVASGNSVSGRVLGVVRTTPAIAEGDDWQLVPGGVFVAVSCDSKALISTWITQTIAPLTLQISELQTLVDTELGNFRIADLETALAEDVAARIALAAAVSQSNSVFSQNVNALSSRVTELESQEFGVSGDQLNQTASDLGSAINTVEVAVATHAGQIAALNSALAEAQSVTSMVPGELDALQTALATLGERITDEAGFPAGTDGHWLRLATGLPVWEAIDKATVGLGNVDNTADLAKPISTATQSALDDKATTTALAALAIGPAGIHNPTGNVDFTATWGTTPRTIRLRGTLTADRTLTLSTTGAVDGARFRIYRIATGAFNWSIGGLKNLAVNTWCDVEFGLGVWILVGYGTL